MNDDDSPPTPFAALSERCGRGAPDEEFDRWCEELGTSLGPTDAPYEAVLSFWFGPMGRCWHPRYRGPSELWFHATEQVDQDVRTRFLALYEAAVAGELDDWAQAPRGALALVLLLDQLPRHIFRGRAQMFATDEQARVFAEVALSAAAIEKMSPPQRAFLYMCLEHSEDADTVARSIAGLDGLCRHPVTRRNRRFYKNLRRAARQHHDLLERFGRYPHRNELLGRNSTPLEQAWLAQTKTPRFAASVQAHRDIAPLRLLVLHSFRQSGARLLSRTKAVRSALSSVADLVYVDAPHPYEATDSTRAELTEDFGPDLEDLGDISHQRCWWNSGADHQTYTGWDESLAYLRRFIAEQGPFDGVLGFSQGAAAAALLMASQAEQDLGLRIAICISGFASRAEEHATLMTAGSIAMPSLHIYGEKDVLVDNDRSIALAGCFVDAQVVTHPGGHFVPALWPVAQIRDFLIAHAQPASTCSQPERIRYARKHHRPIGLEPAGQALWDALQDAAQPERPDAPAPGEAASSSSTPPEASPSLDVLVARALDAEGAAARLKACEDLHVILWSLQRDYDHRHAEGLLAPLPGDEFYRLYLQALEHAPEQFEPWVADIPRLGEWKLLTRLAVYAFIAPQTEVTGRLWEQIVELFRRQLVLEADSDAPPSDCAVAAPRTQSATQRVCGLAGEIAVRMFPAPERTDSYVAYTRLVSRLSKRYRSSNGPVPTLRAQRRQAALVWHDDDEQAPISDEVRRPRPVPVKPCSAEELSPLIDHLQAKDGVDDQTSFVRGTHMPDGRLDLCKQVVGPDGIGPVLDGLADNPHVTRLMIGNNIVGNTGALAIADFIRSGRSHIDVWYIAGNEIDAEGLVPVCEALYDNPHVRSLWLKRNPLGPQAGPLLAQLLRRNQNIHTLDLVNTGLLDEGACAVIEALPDNIGLRHLYLGTNGLGPKSAEALGSVLADNDRLTSLFVSCNRLGDEGVEHLASALRRNTGLERLGLASNRLGPASASVLAEALVEHPRLRFLDLGWTRATAAVGELGNRIGNEGAAALAGLLAHNSTIQALDLSHNRISQAGIDAIGEVLHSNRSLVFLRHPQHGKAVNHDSLGALHKRLDDNFAALQEREPTLRRENITTPMSTQQILSVYRTA